MALYLKFEAVRKAVNMFGEVLRFVFINTIAAVQNYFILFGNEAIREQVKLARVEHFHLIIFTSNPEGRI